MGRYDHWARVRASNYVWKAGRITKMEAKNCELEVSMNIFVLSKNPRRAAEQHCDKHVVKMILETAQLLYSAHPDKPHEAAQKRTHANHPCAIWTRASLANYQWLCTLGFWLCQEYTQRYKRTHKTEAHILWLISHPPDLPDKGRTPFAQAMPDECKREDPVVAQRRQYLEKKQRMLMWTRREIPAFIQAACQTQWFGAAIAMSKL